MNIERYEELGEKLSKRLFESFNDSQQERSRKEQAIETAKETLIDELRKRKLVYDPEVVDIYPHCIKVEKETLEFPIYREAVEATRSKMKERGVVLDLFSF